MDTYIQEYEQSGKDRAEYGKLIFKAIAERIKINQKDIYTFAEIFIKPIRRFCGQCPQNRTLLTQWNNWKGRSLPPE